MKPLIVDVRHLYPRLIQDLASVRTMLCFFKLYNCPLPTTTRYSSHAHCTLTHTRILFIPQRSPIHQFSHLHAVCLPCPQPSPARACTGDHPPSAPVWMCSQHPSTRASASQARATSSSLAHAREASSSEPPSTERCARCRHGATSLGLGRYACTHRPGRALSWTCFELACPLGRKQSC